MCAKPDTCPWGQSPRTSKQDSFRERVELCLRLLSVQGSGDGSLLTLSSIVSLVRPRTTSPTGYQKPEVKGHPQGSSRKDGDTRHL